MKKIISVIIIAFLVQLNYSCTKKEEFNNNENRLKRLETLDYDGLKERSGNLHNAFLDHVYSNTSPEDLHSDLTIRKIDNVIDLGVSFFSKRNLTGTGDYLDELQIIQKKKSLFITDPFTAFDYINDALISDSSKALITIIKSVLVGSKNPTPEYFKTKVNLIYENRMNLPDLTNQEKYYIATICGVAISSFEYWDENAILWRKNPLRAPDKRKIAEFVIADMTGASWGSTLPGVGTAFGAALASGMIAWSWED